MIIKDFTMGKKENELKQNILFQLYNITHIASSQEIKDFH